MNKDDRIEFCCHTKMSKLQGINTAKEYIEEAINRGYSSIAITDTNSTQAFFEASDYLRFYENKKDFKIIYGTELFFKDNKNLKNIYSIYIYVKEQKGLKNLYKLISNAYSNSDNKVYIYKSELDSNRDGLLYAAIGNESEVYKNIDEKNIEDILKYYDFVGIEPNKSEKEINKKISEVCLKTNTLLIGTSECNFINKQDYRCNEILNFYNKLDNIEIGNNSYFQNTNELINSFNYIENAKRIIIDNPMQIAQKIPKIELFSNESDNYPKIAFADMIISKKCYDKAHELYGENISKEIKERLQLELHSIISNNFQTIYLICSELVEYSNKLGYEVGNRGSVGNSFVAYLLGVTNINPIEYNLPFEIFAGKNYDKEPDIDLYFSSKIQEKIFEFLQKKYGKGKIIWGGTVGCLGNNTISNCYKEYANNFEKKNINDKDEIINKLSGVKKCTGEHPGGIFIIPENMDILDFCPMEIGEKGHIKTHVDYNSINDYVLYKFDILCSDDLTMLHELEKATNTNSRDIKLDDKETLKLFLHANDKSYKESINGIPEFSTEFVKKMIEISKPRNFNDLVCISALSHGTGTWTYNASLLIETENKKLDEVISNRADLYNYLISKKIDKDTAYDITKFIIRGRATRGRILWQDKWEEYKKITEEHNIPEWYIHSAEKINYLFPKSHAIDYTMNAFKIAWYKVHYPELFYKIYFKIKSDLNVKNYYCKREVETELNRLYDEKETYENNNEFDYDRNKNNKIKDLELILEMYNKGILKEQKEINDEIPDYNIDERMRLLGFTEEEIQFIKCESTKIYSIPSTEKKDYLKHNTYIYDKFNDKEISQIETDSEDNIYILTYEGKLFKTKEHEENFELLSNNISKIYFLFGIGLLKITNENIILPIEEDKEWNNINIYLNNNNCKYKKIETSEMHIVLLTNEGNVRAACGGYPDLGIIPDNFINVEDITIVEDEYGVDSPFIYKNGICTKLYIE